MKTISQDIIDKRKSKLINAKIKLKEYFVGIDYVIEQIIKDIELWFLYPEFLTRPTIINLWGMTGCGKTDLVYKLIEYLGMSESFLNIDMGIETNDVKFNPSISEVFSENDITTDVHSVILIDEIQKYGSKGLVATRYDDLWKLLSEGKLIDNYDRIRKIQNGINRIQFNIYNDFEKSINKLKINSETKQIQPPAGFTNEQWTFLTGDDGESNNQKKILVLLHEIISTVKITQEDIDEIWKLKMLFENQNDFIYTKIQCDNAVNKMHYLRVLLESCDPFILLKFYKRKLEEIKNHDITNNDDEKFIFSKMLIFISGNIDQLFHTDNVGINIEELYKMTKEITIDKVKTALFKIFRPEQVSRFGNNHIIYYSLKIEDFKELTKREISRYIMHIKNKFDIDISNDLKKYDIFKLVQDEGIFPSQGVRPFISSVTKILSDLTLKILVKHSNK